MSLREEEREIVVRLEMEKADSTFAENEGLVDNGSESGDTNAATAPASDSEQVTNGGAPIDDDNAD